MAVFVTAAAVASPPPSDLRTFGITSVNTIVPTNTNNVPSQWYGVNGLLKYTIENSNDTNLRNVTTSVTVSDEHSVVSTYTELMHTYWVTTLPIMYSHWLGTASPISGTAIGTLAEAICKCCQMFW